MIPITYFIHIYSIRMSISRDSKTKTTVQKALNLGKKEHNLRSRGTVQKKSKELLKIYQTICTWYIITSISWYLQAINFLYYYHYSRCIMKIIFLYTRHWTTDVGPLKWFGQNCTTELPNIQQVCTRVLQIKIVLLCIYFLQGSWWKCWKFFSDQSVWDVQT